ncbi:MAG: hypothetical protein F6K19_49450, partial [Cyanothece sp. SIO1E1]|nr:hypothetical protein [Cyanothece sp. SIO1E1]
MLKLTYTEAGLHLERVATSLEVMVTRRAMLAVRLGHTLHIEPGRASFLLPENAPKLAHLQSILPLEHPQAITLAAVDSQYVEVSLVGVWIAHSSAADECPFLSCTAVGNP